jgi:hypothetical protein
MDDINNYSDDIHIIENNEHDRLVIEDDVDIMSLPVQSTMSSTDKLSLELLMNKSHYRKYIENNDSQRHDEHQEYIYELNKYKRDIIKMTTLLLEEPDTQISVTINELFNEYTKEIIQYSKHKDIENKNQFNDDNMLFGTIDRSTHTPSARSKILTTSFWGKSVKF